MNRTRTLLVIGVFMLSLAVLAALELRVEEPVASEGQMVTGSLSKEAPVLPKLPDLSAAENGKGVLVPLDNGILRDTPSESPFVPAETPPAASAPTPPPAPETPPLAETPPVSSIPVGDIAPAGTFGEEAVASVGEEKAAPAPKPEKKTETPAPARQPQKERREAKAETGDAPVVLTAKAPSKLQAGQTAITATRLELGKDVVFRITGAAPIQTKTLLLKEPDRYVVDLQGKWGIDVPRVPKDLWIKTIRVGQHEEATRLVFELTRTPESAKVVKINAKTVEVRIK